MTKEIIIIALIMVIVYLIWQKQQQPKQVSPEIIQQLQSQIKLYQNLYQQRIAKDLGDSEKKYLTKQLALCEEIINKPQTNSETQTDFSQEDKNSQENSEELETLLTAKDKENQEQLRKINVLFDENANNYKTIDFNGLYSLLQKIAERERERAN